MPISPFAILIGGICVILIFGFLVWKRSSSRFSDQRKTKADVAMIAEKLKANLTTVRWYSEIILDQDFGKLNYAQAEYLHQANEACVQVTQSLRALLERAGLEKKSTMQFPCAAEGKE